MSGRYADDPYSPPRRGGGGGGGGERWDRDRMDSYAERDRYEEVDYYSRPQRREPSPRRYETRERVVYEERDRYETPSRPRYRYEDEPDRTAGAMVRRPREEERDIDIEIRRREYERPPAEFERPRFVRRQSSLDTYDRKPMPRYGDVARVREETIVVPAGGRRRSPPRYRSPPRFEEFEETRFTEQDRYGEEEVRGYREREFERVRRNDDVEYEIEEREEIVEEIPKPKRGKTKMPMRLVSIEVLEQLNYPYEQEVRSIGANQPSRTNSTQNETIIIQLALHKTHIDEVIRLSRERNSRRGGGEESMYQPLLLLHS